MVKKLLVMGSLPQPIIIIPKTNCYHHLFEIMMTHTGMTKHLPPHALFTFWVSPKKYLHYTIIPCFLMRIYWNIQKTSMKTRAGLLTLFFMFVAPRKQMTPWHRGAMK